MDWLKLDAKLPAHSKTYKAGPEAMWLYVAGLCHAALYETDGLIERHHIARLTFLENPEKHTASLVAAGLWEEVDGDGYRIHDYLAHQMSVAELRSLRAKKAKAGAAGGRKSGAARRSKAEAPGSSEPEAPASSNLEARQRSKAEPEKNREEKSREEEIRAEKTLKASSTKRRHQLPTDFQPNDVGQRLCRELNLDLPSELSKFSNHHRSKGSVMVDWQAAWRTWIQRAADFAPAGPSSRAKGHVPYQNPPQEVYLDTAI